MQKWQRSLENSITSPEELTTRFRLDASLSKVTSLFPMRISPYYFDLIKEWGDPIWRQCVPDVREVEDLSQVSDPLCEEDLSPVPGLIHRYPDRVVWLVSSTCAVYCRFCMRKRHVGCPDWTRVNADTILDYLASRPVIRDVLLSGGDPLLLTDDALEELLHRLKSIPHIEMVRIGTRVPVTLPERVTANLCKMLRNYHPIYINTHFNHPLEITPQSGSACSKLADAGIPLGNQTVLLKDVNDAPGVIKRLNQMLLAMRVRPYYVHHMDKVRGTAHFRTTVQKGMEVMAEIRGYTSGLATPHYVIDLPGGKGKVPILPAYPVRQGTCWNLVNYLGEEVSYPE